MSFISDLLIEISSFRIRVGNKLNALANRIGVLNNLTTTNKNNLVDAINEVNGNIPTDVGIRKTIRNNVSGAYRRTVIPLVLLDNSYISRDSYFFGEVHAKRNNALNSILFSVKISAGKYYNSETPIVNITYGKDYGGVTFKPVTFTYNGLKYFGIDFGSTAANFTHATIDGVSDDWSYISVVDYLDTLNNIVLNQEISDTITDYIYVSDQNNKIEKSLNKIEAEAFIKNGGNGSNILLDDGNVKAVSDFALAGSLGNYLPLTGGTLTGELSVTNTLSVWTATQGTNRDAIFEFKRGNTVNIEYGSTAWADARLIFNNNFTIERRVSGSSSNLLHISSTGLITSLNDGDSSQWKQAFDWGRGLRVDGNGSIIHNSTTGDTNDIRNASMYSIGINKPSSGNGSIVNFTPYSSSGNHYGFDLYMAAASDRFFIRRETASVKQSWIEVIHENNLDSQATSLGFIKSSALPTVNNGALTLTTGTGLSGSANFTANQSGNSSFSVGIASTHKLPTVAEWNALPTTNTTYTAGTGLTLTGTVFGQAITTSGTGTYVQSITQTASGFQVNLGTPPNTNTTYALATDAELASTTSTTARLISGQRLNAWATTKGFLTSVPTMTAATEGTAKLFSATVQSVAATSVSATASRTYGIQKNSSGQLVVNVPWTNTIYSAGTLALLQAGTNGTNRLWSAIILAQRFTEIEQQVAYFNDVLNINTRVSWGTNVLAGERNQIQGARNVVNGFDINIFGSRNVSSGINNQINGFANVANGAFNTINGAYSSITGSQSNTIGNYLFARDKQTVLGMYNKVYDVGADEGLRVVFGTGSNDFDKFNAVEIYDDHRTEFHGKAAYDEETRDPEWFTEDYTHVDTYQVGYDHLPHRARDSTPCEANILRLSVRYSSNSNPDDDRFTDISDLKHAFNVHGIVDGSIFDGTIDINRIHTKGTLEFSPATTTKLISDAKIDSNNLLIVRYNFGKGIVDIIGYTNSASLLSHKTDSNSVTVLLGSFILKQNDLGQTVAFFEFNQQII